MRASPLLLAIILLAACSSGPGASQSPTHSGAPTATPRSSATPATSASPGGAATSPPVGSATASPSDALLRVLNTGLTHPEFPFMVAAAFDEEELADLLDELGVTGGLPSVNFEREVVIYLGISGSSSCPERFQQLFVDEAAARVYGLWAAQQPGQPCTDDLQGQGILLAVARAALPDQPFLLSLRESPICVDCVDHPDQLLVDPSR